MSLLVNNLSFGYPGEAPCLSDLNFQVTRGSFVSIIGPSGCGKSTLLKVIAGLLSGSAGRVSFNGSAISADDTLWHPQTDMCLPHKRVLANMTLAADLAGVDSAVARKQALAHLEAFGLGDIADKWPSQLSVGMRQRVCLARSFLVERPVLLLDEPLSSVDEVTRLGMQDWLEGLFLRTERTIIMVTHDLVEACRMSDQVIALNSQGNLVGNIEVPVERSERSSELGQQSLLKLKTQLMGLISN